MNTSDADLINAIASKQLGQAPTAAPQAPAVDPAQAQAPQPQAPQPPKADPSPTNMEKAQAKVAPTDQAADDAALVSYIKVGDREYTQQQLEGTLKRYSDLNYKWAQNSEVVKVAERMMEAAKKAGHEATPADIAGFIEAATQAYLKNPQFGDQGKGQQAQSAKGKPPMSEGDEPETLGDPDAMYEQWEKENAVKLPPGFREQSKAVAGLKSQLENLTSLIQQALKGDANGQGQQAQAAQSDARLKMISNNLNMSFQQAGLPADEQTRADFRAFSAQRGYDFPDFMSPELTATVVQDFKANKDAPEMRRLLDVAKKRQAFTGMVEGTPGAGAAPVASGADPMLTQMLNTAMGKKFNQG